jgi:hypothetical protein
VTHRQEISDVLFDPARHTSILILEILPVEKTGLSEIRGHTPWALSNMRKRAAIA